jgi:hypothetical protein
MKMETVRSSETLVRVYRLGGIATGHGPSGLSSIPDKGKDFSLRHGVQPGSGAQWVLGALIPAGVCSFHLVQSLSIHPLPHTSAWCGA